MSTNKTSRICSPLNRFSLSLLNFLIQKDSRSPPRVFLYRFYTKRQVCDLKVERSKWITFILCIFAVFQVSLFAYFLLGETLLPGSYEQTSYRFGYFDVRWYQIREDGSRVSVKLPHDFDLKPGETLILETKLSSALRGSDSLCFHSNRQDLKIYINDNLIQEYSDKNNRLFGLSSPSCYVFCDLTPKSLNGTLRVECVSPTGYSKTFSAVYYGSKMGIWSHIVEGQMLDILMAIIMLVAGVVCTIFGIYFSHVYIEESPLSYFGWICLLASSLVIFYSDLRQLIFPNVSVASDVLVYLLMFLPIPMALYMNTIQKGRYEKIYTIQCYVSLATILITSFLHITGIREFAQTFLIMVLVLFLFLFVIILTLFMDIANRQIKYYLYPAIAIFGCLILGMVQIIFYIFHGFTFQGTLLCLELFFIMIGTIISTFQEVSHKDVELKDAISSSQSKAQFLANMSHEIRTPINAVLGMDEMILRESTEANVREYALDLQRAGQNLLALINDILDYSKIESNKLDIIEVDYELSSLINDSYNMIASRAKDKQLDLRIESSENLPSRLHGDEVRVRQIILNFLTNAVKYTTVGSVILQVSGEKLSDEQYLLKISVTDTGIGIRKEDLGKLFDSFQRVDESRNRSIEGTGLGLSIAKQLVTLMHGTISVSSTYGKGSTFTFEIPQGIVSQENLNDLTLQYTSHKSSNEIFHESFTAPDAKILVVDDVAVNLKVVKGLLKETRIQIDTAQSGEECLSLVARHHYDIIFLDHMMPRMDGIETFEQMKQLSVNPNNDTPVIMLTANALSGAKEEYLKNGFTDYLSKPIQDSLLHQMILNYLPKKLIHTDEEKTYATTETATFVKQLNQFLDADAGLDYYDGNEEFYREILVAYVEDCDLTKLEEPYSEKNWPDYQVATHSLKSSSTYIGATKLAEEARKLEYAAKDLDCDYIKEHHDSVMRMYRETVEHLKKVLNM